MTTLGAPSFDLSTWVARLVKAGVPAAQAEVQAEILREAVTHEVQANLSATIDARMTARATVLPGDPKQSATRGDIYNLSGDVILIHKDIELVEQRIETRLAQMDAKIDGVVQRLDAKIDGVVQRLDAKIDLVRKDMDALRHDLLIKLGGMLVVAVGIILGVLKL